MGKLRLEIPFREGWETSARLTQKELRDLLNQPFSFLDKGAQCYVFQSRDGKYVIKLFRFDQPHFLSKQKVGPFEKLFSACLLAYTEAPEETGVVHLHLNRTMQELPILFATSPTGQALQIPLDRYRFAIQKKAEPFRKVLLRAENKEKLIDSFVSLLYSRIEKEIGNSDPTLHRNFGFLDGKALEIDFGNYFTHPSSKIGEMHRFTHRLRRWLKHHDPASVAYLDKKVKECESQFSS